MGHYLSEMSGELTELELEQSRVAQELYQRGYSDPVSANSHRGKIETQGIDPRPLRYHEPCGTAVFDPDTHDRYCPAKGLPEGFSTVESY